MPIVLVRRLQSAGDPRSRSSQEIGPRRWPSQWGELRWESSTKVREIIKYGPDLIKFCATGGVLSKGDRVGGQQYTLEEMQAIRAATVHAAELIGWPDDVGAIDAGRFEDITSVAGNPLEDVTFLEGVRFVMKGGKAYKN